MEMEFSEEIRNYIITLTLILIFSIILDIAIFSNSKNISILTNVYYLGQSIMITSTIMTFILFIIAYLSYKGKYLKVKKKD
jgi:uncharacterized membrane protein YciS (DUF1049 family)